MNLAERTIFNFGDSGLARPDIDGRYRSNHFFSGPDGISEAEAIRQWLTGCTHGIFPGTPEWQYIERLVELANEAEAYV
jgi:hypothetical protein